MSRTTITVTRKDVAIVAKIAFPEYTGTKHKVCVTDSLVRITAADLTWSGGGSKTEYVALRQVGTEWQRVELTAISPWSGETWSGVIRDDMMLVEHCIFAGKSMGLTYHVSPTSIFMTTTKLLPNTDILSQDSELRWAEETVLKAHASLISNARDEEYRRAGLSRSGVEATKDRLITRGLLRANKNGATKITINGENLARTLSQRPNRYV